MQVRFWGVRGSCPTPNTTEELQVRLRDVLLRLGQDETPPDLHNAAAIDNWLRSLPRFLSTLTGGNTSCIEVRTKAGDLIIIDAGTGIRVLGNHLMKEEFGKGRGHAHVFFTHYHWDHLQGWPFFAPAYIPGNRFEMYARHSDLRERLCFQQQEPFFPSASWDDMKATTNYHQLPAEPIELCEGRVRVSTIELDHPSRAYAYRFEADGQVFVSASDAAYHDLDEEAIGPYLDFFRDADLLIFDAQFTLSETYEKRTWGHSAAIIGVELACQAGVKRLALFHHDPASGEEHLSRLLLAARNYVSVLPTAPGAPRCEVFLAREGKTINL